MNKIPALAPAPLPTMMATGVARPRAQGQLITRTLMARARAKPMVCPIASQTMPVISAKRSTVGTKTADTLSAILARGALLAAASSTTRIIWLTVVSPLTRVA